MKKTLHSEQANILREHLVELREKAGMTQRDLARAIDGDHGMIAKIELGERRLDVIEYHCLLRAMGGDPAEEASKLMQLLDCVKWFALQKLVATMMRENSKMLHRGSTQLEIVGKIRIIVRAHGG